MIFLLYSVFIYLFSMNQPKPSKAFDVKVKVIQSGKEKIEEVIKFVVYR